MNVSQPLWLEAPERPHLADGEVHVWRACLRQDQGTLLACWESLSADERERAGRFHFRRDREHFVTARGVLRDLLGRYTGVEPRLLRFSYDRYGKPALSGGAGGAPLHFNVSHSNGLALYAVTRGCEVGIDLEFVREDFATLEIAERFFSAREVSALRARPRFLRLLGAQGGLREGARRGAFIPAGPLHRVAYARRAGRAPVHGGRPAGGRPLVSNRAVSGRGLQGRPRGQGRAGVAALLPLALKIFKSTRRRARRGPRRPGRR